MLVDIMAMWCPIVAVAASSENYEIAKWEEGTAMPVGNYVFEMVRIPSTNSSSRGHVMVAGGYDNGVYFDGVYMYDVDAGTWSDPAAAMPVASHGVGIVHTPSVDGNSRGQVMMAGGYTKSGGYLDSVYFYDVEAGTWSDPAATMPVARRHFEMVHIPSVDNIGRGQVMVAGGQNNGGYMDSVYMYDVDAGTWSVPTAAMPVARRSFGMVHIPSVDDVGRGQVMVAGGLNSNGGHMDSAYMYDADADTWSGPVAAIPVASSYFGMVYIPSFDGTDRGQVMVAGGGNGGDDDSVLDSVYMYNVDADTWSGPAAAIPVARNHFGMVYIPLADGIGRGQVMVAGGYNGGSLDSVYFSAPVTTTSTTTTTTSITTTTTATAATATATATATTTTTTTTSTTVATTTWLGVNDECDPLADTCNTSNNLVCSVDAYECRYTATALGAKCSSGSAAVAVLAVLLVLALGSTAWFGVKFRDTSRELRQLRAMQELDGQQTVGMIDNPIALERRVPRPPAELPRPVNATAPLAENQLTYMEPAAGVQTYAGAAADGNDGNASYAQVYSLYDATVSGRNATPVQLDADNYVLDASA